MAGFRGPQQNPSELSESAYLQIFATKTSFFTIAGKQAICGCQKTYTHTGTFPQTPFLMFRYVLWLCTGCTKALQKWALQKLYESRLYESSLKALRKLSESSLKTLRKQALRKLSESFTKALRKLSKSSLKILRKQALRKLSESSTIAGSTKALQKLSESSPKALRKLSESSLKALRKLSENSLETLRKLYESYLKAGSPKALRKQADFCWNPFKSKLT